MSTSRKVCVVTGSRAEYGLLYWILREIERIDDLELQLVVTGMHLSSEFGYTYRQIESDGFSIKRKVPMELLCDSAAGIAKSTGLGLMGFADVFEELKPEIVLMLGDRFELLAASSAALFAALPIAHIHGGEVTIGAFDEAIRHSITKMSHIHFTSTESYRQRVIQLGENPSNVFTVGAPGLDNIHRLTLMSRTDLETAIAMELGPRSLLVTWNPVTLEPGRTKEDFSVLLNVLDKLENVRLIFTKANADPEGRIVNEMIDNYVATRTDKAVAHTSLGQLRYLSTLKYVSGVVGNSSSGIIEAPSLFTGTINIGDRQKGRVRAASVIDCCPNKTSITAALQVLFSGSFQQSLSGIENPYDGGGNTSEKIVDILRSHKLKGIEKKSFYDIKTNIETDE